MENLKQSVVLFGHPELVNVAYELLTFGGEELTVVYEDEANEVDVVCRPVLTQGVSASYITLEFDTELYVVKAFQEYIMERFDLLNSLAKHVDVHTDTEEVYYRFKGDFYSLYEVEGIGAFGDRPRSYDQYVHEYEQTGWDLDEMIQAFDLLKPNFKLVPQTATTA